MTKTTPFALAASALLALSLTLAARAEDAKPCCADTQAKTAAKADCCAAAQAKAGSGECCAASGQYVMIKVKGRHADRLGTALAKLDGVSDVSTCAESRFTKVAYDKDKVCADKILAAVKDAGYRVETRRVAFAVEGLSCGACATKATQALSRVKGVSDAKVCSESKMATVDFNPNKVKAEQLFAALDAAGFKAAGSVN